MARPYYIEEELNKTATHHLSIKALWETKWMFPCSKSIYPFGEGQFSDFEPVFEKLIKLDLREPYNSDSYAAPFFPVAEELIEEAEAAERDGNNRIACDLYLRAAAVYRIARFPINYATGLNAEAWKRGQNAYLKGGKYLSPPAQQLLIPFNHGINSEIGTKIPVVIRIPPSANSASPAPVILLLSGLDGYRTDQHAFVNNHLARGHVVIVVDIPGTGDSPAIRNDPESPDRLWSSVLDWISGDEGEKLGLDSKRVVARGLSTGGYYAMRIAHTHKDRLLAVVAHGGGCHFMFDKRWIEKQNEMEYPFTLSDALVYKFGYETKKGYIADAQKRFSLLLDGTLDRTSAPLLLANGMNDSIFPIEDSLLALQHGGIKSARFIESSGHMGFPKVEEYIYDWIDNQLIQRKCLSR